MIGTIVLVELTVTLGYQEARGEAIVFGEEPFCEEEGRVRIEIGEVLFGAVSEEEFRVAGWWQRNGIHIDILGLITIGIDGKMIFVVEQETVILAGCFGIGGIGTE
jgi:hypothetical protein